MQAHPLLREPSFGFGAGYALPTTYASDPFFESQPATSSPVGFGLPKTYVTDPFLEFYPAADLLDSPAGLMIPGRKQLHSDQYCLGCLEYFPETTPREWAGGDEEKRSSGVAKQSMAARERRRRITAKTQELGKLIPGAQKMNTAQMLQAASKYVKFLQAQLALLQQIASGHQGRKGMLEAEELPVLLASSAIQEKLYSEEKCLAPNEFLRNLHPIEAVDL